LLADLGRLVLVEALGQRYGNICRDALQHGRPIETCEREELGADHRFVSSRLFRRWSFPEPMILAMESCGDRAAIEALDEHPRELAKVLFLSRGLVDIVLFPGSLVGRLDDFDAWARLGESEVLAMAEDVSAELSDQDEPFHQSEHAIDEVRNRARRALFDASLQSLSTTTRQAEENHRRAEEFRLERDKLKRQVTLDPVLNIGNRRYFDSRLLEEHKRGLRTGRPLSLIFFDLDHFKSFNDNYGHQLGDEVLRAATRTIGQCLRSSDVFARYGGEEFAVICPETEFAGAVSLADRMRHCLERLEVLRRGRSVRVTASFGVTTVEQLQEVHSVESLVEAADQWLFEAKRAGRNCVRGALFSTSAATGALANPWDAGALAPSESGSGPASREL
jgi:diguanylate cyclase (GGDEF)-like protein